MYIHMYSVQNVHYIRVPGKLVSAGDCKVVNVCGVNEDGIERYSGIFIILNHQNPEKKGTFKL